MKRIIGLFLSAFFLSSTLFAANHSAAVESLNGIAAVVNNEVITQSALNESIDLYKKQLQSQNQTLPPKSQLKKQVLSQLIDEKLVLQIAKNNNIKVSKAELNKAIAGIAQQNHMSTQELKQQIKQHGMNYPDYEKRIKTQLLLNKTERRAVGHTIQVSPKEVKAAMNKSMATANSNVPEYHLEAMLIPLSNGPSPQELQKAQAKAKSIMQQLHAGNAFSTIALTEDFNGMPIQGGDMGWRQLSQLPPSISASIAGSITGSIVGPIQTPNGFYIIKVMQVRTLNPDHVVKLTHLKTILLKTGQTKTGNEVKAQLNKIRTDILKGASFSKMAAKYSEDSKSKHKGGDLGWVSSKDLPAQLVSTVQNLKKGQISKPIQTQEGWQIVQVEGYKTVNNTKAHMQEQVKRMLYVQKFQSAVNTWVHKLRGEAFIKVMG